MTEQIGYCEYGDCYLGDSETYSPGLSAVPDDTDRRKGPVEFLVTDEFEGWVCPEHKEKLLMDQESRVEAEFHIRSEEFRDSIGILRS